MTFNVKFIFSKKKLKPCNLKLCNVNNFNTSIFLYIHIKKEIYVYIYIYIDFDCVSAWDLSKKNIKAKSKIFKIASIFKQTRRTT